MHDKCHRLHVHVLPPEDEYFIYSKHVEDIIGINLKRKCIWLILITQILQYFAVL